MDELLKRLDEIKAEAEALRDSDEEGRLDKIRALLAERKELESKIEAEQALSELERGAPQLEVVVDDGDDDDSDADDGDADSDGDADDADKGDEVEDDGGAGEEEAVSQPAAVAAAAATPVDNEAPEKPEMTKIPLVASGNVAGTNPGDPLDLRSIERIHRFAGKVDPRGGEVRAIFASMQTGDGPALSDRNTAAQNSAIMASATHNIQPITAAAAFCGPDDIVLDICAAGTDARPVQGLFRTVPVRGKFRFMETASLADVSAGIQVWEEADQLDVDSGDSATWKPCVDMTCRDEVTVTPYAIPACTLLGTWQQLSAPEQVANWLGQMQKQYSKVAETRLLDRLRAQSHNYSVDIAQGIWNTVQLVLAHVESTVGAANRGTTEGYVLVAPYGFTAALAADEGMRGFSQNLAVQRIQAILREDYGISIVEAYETDSTVAAAYRTGAVNLPAVGDAPTAFTPGTHSPSTYPIYVFNPDSFLAGSSDVVDAGYVRDSNLVRQNVVQYFWEGMEFLQKTCDHLAFTFELNTCPNGAATALVDGPACTD